MAAESLPEEEESDDEDADEPLSNEDEQRRLESPEEARQSFEKIVRDKFVDGLLPVSGSAKMGADSADRLPSSGSTTTTSITTMIGTSTVEMMKSGGLTTRRRIALFTKKQ